MIQKILHKTWESWWDEKGLHRYYGPANLNGWYCHGYEIGIEDEHGISKR